MKSLVVAATAIVLSGLVFGNTAEAAFYKHRYGRGGVTASERAAIARDQAHVNALKRHARADGHVSLWERMRIRAAETRHDALVYSY